MNKINLTFNYKSISWHLRAKHTKLIQEVKCLDIIKYSSIIKVEFLLVNQLIKE